MLHLENFKNKQHPFKRMRVDENGSLEKSTDITDLIFDKFNKSLETTGGEKSGINGKN